MYLILFFSLVSFSCGYAEEIFPIEILEEEEEGEIARRDEKQTLYDRNLQTLERERRERFSREHGYHYNDTSTYESPRREPYYPHDYPAHEYYDY